MNLMLMEALADKDWPRAHTYKKIVEDQIKTVGKCAKADVDSAVNQLANTDGYIDQHEDGVRLTLRTLEDSYWHMLFSICSEGKK